MMLDLPGHDGVGYGFALEEANQFAELTDADPLDARRLLVDLRRSFFFDGSNDHLDAAPLRAFEHEERESPVTGYQSILHI
jgi:hypothetical protein